MFINKQGQDLEVYYYERVPFRVPCIPFNPEMRVNYSLQGAKSLSNSFEFDPTQGFMATIDSVDDSFESNGSSFTCLATFNDKKASQTFTAHKLDNKMLTLESSNQIEVNETMHLTSAVLNKQTTLGCVMSIPVDPDQFDLNITFNLNDNGVRIDMFFCMMFSFSFHFVYSLF